MWGVSKKLSIYDSLDKNKLILQWISIFALPIHKVLMQKNPKNAMLVLHVFTVLNETVTC